MLVHSFMMRFSRRMQKRVQSVPEAAMAALMHADWPGNVRELENFIERCVILTQGDELNVPRTELKETASCTTMPAAPLFHDAERQVIIGALKSASGRIAGRGGAAERLGLKRTTLQNKMYRLNITRSDYSVALESERAPRRTQAAYDADSQQPGPPSAADGSSFLWSQDDSRSSDQWEAPNRSKSA
jgi:DNA-binding NtrC family response regulator